jgi:hypothetical protein
VYNGVSIWCLSGVNFPAASTYKHGPNLLAPLYIPAKLCIPPEGNLQTLQLKYYAG